LETLNIKNLPAIPLGNPQTTTNMAVEQVVTDADLLEVLQEIDAVRQQALSLLTLQESMTLSNKKTSRSSAASGSDTPSAQEIELSRQQSLLHAYMAQLRGLQRRAVMSVRQTKLATADARGEIDTLHLKLQNLYYEQRHLRGEINACEGYE
jgi:THO complex subunit 5